MPRTPKSPQDKKALSLKKECRNLYGENAKSSRKNIPRAKARDHRKNRHRQNQVLAGVDRLDEAAAEVVESTARHDIRHGWDWKKAPDRPLGEIIKDGLAARERRAGGKARRRVKRAESDARWEAHLSASRETAP